MTPSRHWTVAHCALAMERIGSLLSRHRASELRALAMARALLVLALAPGCADLTRPPPDRVRPAQGESVAPTAVAPVNVPIAAVEGALPGLAEPEMITASHILVAYQGATRAKPTVTRTRDQARELAEQLSAKAHEPGADFARLARESSDAPTGIEGGALSFRRQQMVKPFSDAAFALKPGEVSEVVETNFGFHIIKRGD